MMRMVVFMCLYVCVTSQSIIPKRPLGYVYNHGSNDAPIHLDIHMGPLCPDSRDAFPAAKQVAQHYGMSTLKLTLHMFPLPYHHQAYLTAIGAQTVRSINGDAAAYQWFEKIYASLDAMSNDATANLTTGGVVSRLAGYASAIGVPVERFLDGMSSEELETDTRAAWKYSCSRGISGTPTFLLNDVILDADPSWTVSEWQKVIDPLLTGTETKHNSTCRIGTRRCEYLPGKVECCTKGEACIPDVGCRCWGNGCINDIQSKNENKACPPDTKKCEYLPGKIECCTKGEGCIPDVGCRCWTEECKVGYRTKKNCIGEECKKNTSRKRKLPMKWKKVRLAH